MGGRRWWEYLDVGNGTMLSEYVEDKEEFAISGGISMERWWGGIVKTILFASLGEVVLEFYRMLIYAI